MRAVLCRSYGPPESLTVETLPDPAPGPGEVLVDVTCIGLNFFDTLIIQNRYQVKPALPFSPGAEFAGVVAARGDGVDTVAPGDRVAAFVTHGACRSRIVLPASQLIPIPEGVSDEAAAGMLVTYGTSLHALSDRARLKPGETVAVLGAAGGVGLAAVEIGAAMGARVIACASSPEKLALARAHGAAETFDYAAGDLKEGLKQLTGGTGVDVVYDPVGGDLAEAALRAIAWQGRYLVVGFAAGEIPKIPLNLVLLKGCDVLGVFWGAFTARDPAGNAANIARLFGWIRDGRLSVHASTVMPLDEAPAAIRLLADRRATGKILLRP